MIKIRDVPKEEVIAALEKVEGQQIVDVREVPAGKEPMNINDSAHRTPQFRVLSDQQVKRVYLATLECLNRTGVEVGNAEARELLSATGALVDGTRVHILRTSSRMP